MWEADFTEAEPLDPRVEAEILETGLSAFTKLHEGIVPFATEEHGPAEVSPGREGGHPQVSAGAGRQRWPERSHLCAQFLTTGAGRA